jgi:uncharacterized protein YkwD
MKKIILLILLLGGNLYALSWNEQIKMEKIFDTFKEKHLAWKTETEQLIKLNTVMKALELSKKKYHSIQSSISYLTYLLCQERSIQASIICPIEYHPKSLYTTSVTDLTLHEVRTRLIEEHNHRRNQRWLSELASNLKLHNIAQNYALKLCDAGEITHTLGGSLLENRYEDGGYEYIMWWENLAQGQDNIMETLDQLTTSLYHRENMYRKGFSEIGIWYCDNIWVINYGTPPNH